MTDAVEITRRCSPAFGRSRCADRSPPTSGVSNRASSNVSCNVDGIASIRDRVRQHREKLRKQGLRPVQIWVPDVRAPEFADAAHRQSAAIAASEMDADDQAFVDAISWEWERGDPEQPE